MRGIVGYDAVMITRSTVAEKLNAYLQGDQTLEALVGWAEAALMDDELETSHTELIADALARIGLADVREYGLTWDDCQSVLRSLGFQARVEVKAAGV